jgi:diguanylate cyclase (GGDEF)-like protein/PAS domain S-box-containing protein
LFYTKQDSQDEMLRVFTCLTVEHDWRLVILAAAICFLGSVVVISLFNRARATRGRTRLIWLGLDAGAAGCGIWATHFIAMLAYEPGFTAGYDAAVTGFSLLIAVVVSGIGLAIALRNSFQWSSAVAGAILGTGIAAMHFTGMSALEVPARLNWSPGLVISAIALGMVLGSAAIFVAVRRNDFCGSLIAALLLTLAIVSVHFTAMSALEMIPDPTRLTDALSISSESLALVIAGAASGILGMCLIAALSDRQRESRMHEQGVLLDTALQNMSHGLCMFDADGRIVLFNERYRELIGLSADFLEGLSLLDLFKRRKTTGDFVGDPEEFFAGVMAKVRAGKWDTKIMESSNGRTLRVVDRPMAGGGWVATFEDITEWRKAEEKISHMARHDPLTDLPNRTLFHEQMEHALRRVRRDEQIAVLCLDLDHFKDINDTLGHPTGDDLLKAVAERLGQAIREADTLARLGGDEFAVIQVEANDQPAQSAALASRLVDLISAPYDINGHHVVIGTSIGVSIAPTDGTEPDHLLKNADMALYRAKADGRGTYRFFEGDMDARAQSRRALELDLRAAVACGQFELYYQPIQTIGPGEIIAFEALVRWNHPTRGMLQPNDFVPLAEQTRLIVPIGDWVLRTACSEAAGWSRKIHIAVNLSAVQFKNRKLVESVEAALSASGLAPGRLELEITETILLHDYEGTLATLRALRNLGVRISMDDFGTGYSSLSYLQSFPFDRIKIDQSFIRELANREESMAIVRAITGLGKSLGISTTAEGVETREQLRLLRAEGCTEVQGYLFSRPCPAAEVETLLLRNSVRRAIA